MFGPSIGNGRGGCSGEPTRSGDNSSIHRAGGIGHRAVLQHYSLRESLYFGAVGEGTESEVKVGLDLERHLCVTRLGRVYIKVRADFAFAL